MGRRERHQRVGWRAVRGPANAILLGTMDVTTAPDREAGGGRTEDARGSAAGFAGDPNVGLAGLVRDAWERRAELECGDPEASELLEQVGDLLDRGNVRVASWDARAGGEAEVQIWLKQAILLMFKVFPAVRMQAGALEAFDRIRLKSDFGAIGVRAVPGAVARWGSYVGPGSVLMPSFVNIGAYVGAGSMVDTWATVGSCAQVGERVHLAGGVGIGGVLEPPQAAPVMIGDDVFVGSRSMITQGARVGEGSVLGEGTLLNPSIPVIDAETGEELGRGEIPAWSVALQGQRRSRFGGGDFHLPCVLVVRKLEPDERHDKTALESILREHGLVT